MRMETRRCGEGSERRQAVGERRRERQDWGGGSGNENRDDDLWSKKDMETKRGGERRETRMDNRV